MDGYQPRGAPNTWAYGVHAPEPQPYSPNGRRYQGLTGFGWWSYLPQSAPRYPAGIQHLPKGQELTTWGALAYANEPSRLGRDDVSATNDPRFSLKY